MKSILLILLTSPICSLGQSLLYEAPKRTVYIDVISDLNQHDLYDKLTKFLLGNDFMIEYRDPEIGIIRTEPKEYRGRSHMSYYNFRVQDNKITLSGNYRQSNASAAIWGTSMRDNFRQIRNVWGQVGEKNAYVDMQRLAEKFGGKLEFRK